MYIEMNNKLTFRPTFTEMTLVTVGKIWPLISFANFAADVAVTKSDISLMCTETRMPFYRDTRQTNIWPSFIEVLLLLVGHILISYMK